MRRTESSLTSKTDKARAPVPLRGSRQPKAIQSSRLHSTMNLCLPLRTAKRPCSSSTWIAKLFVAQSSAEDLSLDEPQARARKDISIQTDSLRAPTPAGEISGSPDWDSEPIASAWMCQHIARR